MATANRPRINRKRVEGGEAAQLCLGANHKPACTQVRSAADPATATVATAAIALELVVTAGSPVQNKGPHRSQERETAAGRPPGSSR